MSKSLVGRVTFVDNSVKAFGKLVASLGLFCGGLVESVMLTVVLSLQL